MKLKNIFMPCLLIVIISQARAGLLIGATRLIYPAAKSEAMLQIFNNDTKPRLIQSWIDNGPAGSQSAESKSPFIIMPPIFRLDQNKGYAIRIIFTGAERLPQDRESVFWINVLEIKPQNYIENKNENNYLKFSVRTRLKLFYRPINLPGTPEESIKNIAWHVVSNNTSYKLECVNSSAYNVSFKQITVKENDKIMDVKVSGMCPAKGKELFQIDGVLGNGQGEVEFTTINDYGGFDAHTAIYG